MIYKLDQMVFTFRENYHIPIGKWIDHFYSADKNSKIKAGNTVRVVPLARFPNADIWIFSSNNVVKSISVWYKSCCPFF